MTKRLQAENKILKNMITTKDQQLVDKELEIAIRDEQISEKNALIKSISKENEELEISNVEFWAVESEYPSTVIIKWFLDSFLSLLSDNAQKRQKRYIRGYGGCKCYGGGSKHCGG